MIWRRSLLMCLGTEGVPDFSTAPAVAPSKTDNATNSHRCLCGRRMNTISITLVKCHFGRRHCQKEECSRPPMGITAARQSTHSSVVMHAQHTCASLTGVEFLLGAPQQRAEHPPGSSWPQKTCAILSKIFVAGSSSEFGCRARVDFLLQKKVPAFTVSDASVANTLCLVLGL